MTLESWLALAGPVLAAGIAWWCKTIWAEAKAASAAAHKNRETTVALVGALRTEFQQYQTHVAERYIAKEDMKEFVAQIIDRIDKLDEKIDRKADRS